jgi:hypothetical protein
MTIHAYGYRKIADELRACGAEMVWIDTDRNRFQRASMMRAGALRAGDTLLLFYLRDLGGSPPADQKWKAMIEDLGVTIKIVDPPEGFAPVVLGRPRKYAPDAGGARLHHSIWTDGIRSEVDRLAAISAHYGSPVTRQVLNGRYGNPSNPKPAPTEEAHG